MTTTMLTLAVFLVEEAFKLVPNFVTDLISIFTKDTPPTADDFNALRAKVAVESYGEFVPDSSLPVKPNIVVPDPVDTVTD